MKKQRRRVNIILALCVLVVACGVAIAGTSQDESSNEQKVEAASEEEFDDNSAGWLLAPLTRQERVERIEKFIKPYSFALYRGSEENTCTAALEYIRNIDPKDILEPIYTAQSMGEPWVRTLLKGCDDGFRPDRNYASVTGWNDDNQYVYYIQANARLRTY